MPHDTRRTGLLVLLLAAMGCDEPTGDLDSGAWCATVEADEECPGVAKAQKRWGGSQTCESPVREIVEITRFIERIEDVTYGWADTADLYDACCYEVEAKVHKGEACAVGRPLRVAGEAAVAPVRWTAGDWTKGPTPDATALPPATRARLATAWRQAGLFEHASVASFGRFALDLLVLGAPAELIAAAHSAALDEVRHARHSLALAVAYGAAVSPGPLPEAGHPSTVSSLTDLATSTFREGCVNETLAAAIAAHQRDCATDPAVLAVLTGIADDEARHAALAWRTVRWAIQAGGEPVREAVRMAWAATATPEAPAGPTDPLAITHGWVSPADEARVARRTLDRVVAPAVEALLG
ncbi:MAG: hypothetical protein ACI9K2_003768 [Myxococcota bacterium]|jgi:hypothetical protein